MVENIVGKGEKCMLYQHFLFFPQCSQEASFIKVVKRLDCVLRSQTFSNKTSKNTGLCAKESNVF